MDTTYVHVLQSNTVLLPHLCFKTDLYISWSRDGKVIVNEQRPKVIKKELETHSSMNLLHGSLDSSY